MEELILKFLSGDGNGDGYGNGYGDGNGDGYGDGDGNGYGYGNGDGNGEIKMEYYKGGKVYYIDEIPCIFQSIKEDVASVLVISLSDFSETQMYVAKQWHLFAHGLSVKLAMDAVKDKYYAQQDVEEKIAEFKRIFKKGTLYSNDEFYRWHYILTGSCESGRQHWMKERGIDITGTMTVESFINLTKEAYGSEVIKRLVD